MSVGRRRRRRRRRRCRRGENVEQAVFEYTFPRPPPPTSCTRDKLFIGSQSVAK